MSECINLRRLAKEDVASALELSTHAGWNQTADDWRTLIDLSPQSCLAIEVDGELASTATLTCYGSRLAWIGMVLTKIEFQGRGFARRLLSETLNLADQMKIETVKLDATDQGRPLYEKLGFRIEQPVERWERPGVGGSVHSTAQSGSLAGEHFGLDRDAFGADRSPLLIALAARNPPLMAESSFLLARSGNRTAYLGPCVSQNVNAARSLISRLARSTAAAISWDLLEQHPYAKAIAQELGFTPRRQLARMVRGRDLRGKEESTYALGGFEFG